MKYACLVPIFASMALAACDNKDAYGDDKLGKYGHGPTVSACDDPDDCRRQNDDAAGQIRAADPEFESKYLDGMTLEEALDQITTHGYIKSRRVRILKAAAVDGVMRIHLALQDAAGEPTSDAASLGLIIKRGETELPFATIGAVA